MNIKAISTNVGKALLVSALFMFLSVIVSLLNGRDSALGPLLISFIITFTVGAFPFIFVRKTYPVTMRDGYLIIFLSWVLSFIFGMLPYVLWGGEFTLVNAWFESVSGYTTTGATILTDIEAVPKSLLFWRSSTHFIGGLGVVVFLLLVLPDASPFRLRLTNLEISSLSREGYRFRSAQTVRIIFCVYIGLAAVETLLLWMAGMSLFDALNHSFSTVATGGFSTHNASIAYFNSDLISAIVLFFMVISAMHFGVIYAVVVKGSFKVLRSPVIKYYLSFLAVLTVLLSISLRVNGNCGSWARALFESAFQIAAFTTTTGFGLTDNASYPLFAGALLMFACIQCGCSGSTSGGLKADRVLIVGKGLAAEIKRMLHPSSVSQVRVGGHPIADSTVKSILLFVVVYFITIFISAILMMACGMDGLEAVSGAIASVGNVGLALGSIGTMGNYSAVPVMAKLICCLDMFLGRVEIFPVLTVFSMIFERQK